MKYILISLLIVNLSYFGWRWANPVNTARVAVSVQASNSAGSIVLLEEAEPVEGRNADMTQVVNNPVRMSEGDRQTCLALGPFNDVFSGQDALEQLIALEQQLSLKAVDVATGEKDYRVLIPPAVSAEDAFRKLRELQASQIDSYVITQGQQAMGISLGVFSTPQAASALRARLEGLGYESEIMEIERLSRTYWLFPDENNEIRAQNWLANRPELELRPMNCIEL